MDYATKNNPSEGTVISTPNQSAGRGQIGSKWESEADKNISLSIILYPKFLKPIEQFDLIKITGLAVRDFIAQFIPEKVTIKWPNDIYVGNKKIAGILIQSSLSSSKIKHAIIGIGINVNQATFLSDAPNPTSIFLETGQENNLEILNRNLCWHVERWYLQLKAGHQMAIHEHYLTHFYKIREDAHFLNVATQEVFKGAIIGIEKTGQLRVFTSSGIQVFDIKGIKFLHENSKV